jgi:hypothetical protein
MDPPALELNAASISARILKEVPSDYAIHADDLILVKYTYKYQKVIMQEYFLL